MGVGKLSSDIGVLVLGGYMPGKPPGLGVAVPWASGVSGWLEPSKGDVEAFVASVCAEGVGCTSEAVDVLISADSGLGLRSFLTMVSLAPQSFNNLVANSMAPILIFAAAANRSRRPRRISRSLSGSVSTV